jgi:hypothetical protein
MIFLKKIYLRSFLEEGPKMYQRNFLFIIYITILFSINSSGQISVINPSFEDQPSDATIPQGWFACEAFTTPDILPGYWGVYNDPAEGNTYIGLITRENGTWESIGQRLSKPVEQNLCYIFSIDLAHSSIYAGYNKPIKLRIWVGNSLCDKDQVIFESPAIDQEEWETYKIKFNPDYKYEYIIIEASSGDSGGTLKGNILIDNMSMIKFCGRA